MGATPAYVLGLVQTGLTIVRALGRRGVPVTALHHDPNEPATATRYARVVLMPPLAGNEDRWLEWLLAEARGLNGVRPVLFPSSDPTWLFLARHRAALAPHYRFALPATDNLEKYPGKHFQYQLAARIGIPMPRMVFPACRADVEKAAASLPYPCLVKPYYSHAGMEVFGFKLASAHDPAELMARYRQAEEQGLGVIIQEYVTGGDDRIYGFVSYTDSSSRVLVSAVSHKLRQCPPLFGVSCLTERAEQPRTEELGRRLLSALRFHGISSIEFKHDPRDGEFKFIEVNVRAPLMMRALLENGVDLASAAYGDLCGEPLEPPRPSRRRRIVNLDGYILSYLVYRRLGRVSLREWLAPIRSRVLDLYYAADDLRPFLRSLRRTLWRWRHGWFRQQLEVLRQAGTEDLIRAMRSSASSGRSDTTGRWWEVDEKRSEGVKRVAGP